MLGVGGFWCVCVRVGIVDLVLFFYMVICSCYCCVLLCLVFVRKCYSWCEFVCVCCVGWLCDCYCLLVVCGCSYGWC